MYYIVQKNIKDIHTFLKQDYRKVNRYYDGVLSLIPEVQDLQKYMKIHFIKTPPVVTA